VTSAALSPRFGWIGLGLARREIEDGREVSVEHAGATARVVALPFADDSR
jgi:hypothetical protein